LGRALFVLFAVVVVVFFGLVVFVVPTVVWTGVPSRLVAGTAAVGEVGVSVTGGEVEAVDLLSSTAFNTTRPTITATATSTAPRPADITTWLLPESGPRPRPDPGKLIETWGRRCGPRTGPADAGHGGDEGASQ
jgi:hypothetical protein